jgi:hypothetical protein
MGHTIVWDNSDKTVVLQQYIPPATKEDLFLLAEESADMLKSVSHTVHLILDERAIKLMLNTADLQFLEKLVPRNQGACVMVVPQIQVAYKLMAQRLGRLVAPKSVNQSFFAPSIEDARLMLQQRFSVRYP